MTLHTGVSLTDGHVSLRLPNLELIHYLAQASDLEGDIEEWLSAALERTDIYYFSVHRDDELVGQIFLHDINRQSGEALVGCHLFQSHDRGLGIGTRALTLLQKFVTDEGKLSRLVYITSADNVASQRIAHKCDFNYIGIPREDPNGLVFGWDIPTG